MLTRIRNARLYATLAEALRVSVQPSVLIAAMVVSSVLGVAGLILSQRLVWVAALVLLPWVPILALKVQEDRRIYGWLAFFELLVVFQLGHFAEHLSQMIELHFLNWPPALATGIVGELNVEPVHFWWNLSILFAGTLLLLFPYRHNRWLWASWSFSVWHQIEHTYIYFWWYLPKGISNHPGILGAGGLVDSANIYIPILTTIGRADLHFWYNLFEIGLFLVAFVVQARRVFGPAARIPAFTRVDWRHPLVLAGGAQIGLVLLVGLIQYSPATLNVPQNYPTIQSAIDAAPEWAIIRIGPGVYHEALSINKPLTLAGSGRGTTVIRLNDDTMPAITIQHTHDVAVKNLTVQGGLYGILVDSSRAVQISQSAVRGAWFAGIRVSRSAVDIGSSEIANTRSPFGMGIELANTVASGDSMIHNDNVHDNPHAGIDIHNSDAMIMRNVVQGNGLRGIAVNEMSMAMVNSNRVSGNGDAGIFVQDHSLAQLEDNQVQGTRPGPTGSADGIRAIYYAEIMLRGNTIQAQPGHTVVVESEASIEPFP